MLAVVDRTNVSTVSSFAGVENPIFYDRFMFSTPIMRGRGYVLGANIGVVGKPIPTFQIAVHGNNFDISPIDNT